MLIAAAAALLYLFGGPGNDGLFGDLMTKYAGDAITSTIADEARRKLALDGLSLLTNDTKDFNDLISEEIELVGALIKNYNSRPEDFENNYLTMLTSQQKLLDKIWEDRRNMLVHITPGEWEKIFESAKAAAQENN